MLLCEHACNFLVNGHNVQTRSLRLNPRRTPTSPIQVSERPHVVLRGPPLSRFFYTRRLAVPLLLDSLSGLAMAGDAETGVVVAKDGGRR